MTTRRREREPENKQPAHARFAPSAAYRWLECPGSVKASEGIDQKSSRYAEEGTACHEAAAAYLTQEQPTLEAAMQAFNVTEDLEFVTEEYVTEIERVSDILFDRDPYGVRFYIEQRMHAPEIDSEFYGTGDWFSVSQGVLRLRDLKTGRGVVAVRDPVTGKINKQLGSYLLLALAFLKAPIGEWDLDPKAIGIERMNVGIIQPRVYARPETTDVTVEELTEFRDEVVWGIRRIRNGDTTRKAGDWCGFCPAKGICPTLRAKAVEAAKMVFDEHDQRFKPVSNYGADDLAAIAAEADLIRAHLAGVEAHIMAIMMKGRSVGGQKLVQKRAIRKWKNEDYSVKRLREAGVTDPHIFKQKMLGPAAMEKMLKTLGIKYDLSAHYEPVSSGVTVAPENDPRPAVTVDIGEVFK